MTARSVITSPMFVVGVALRLALLIAVTPASVSAWFGPFFSNGPSFATINPWGDWLAAGGSDLSFPYGYGMWLFLKPAVGGLTTLGASAALAYLCALLLADVATFVLLQRLLPGRSTLVTAAYWLSPIVLVATYVFGANDVVPIALLVAALVLLRGNRGAWAGAALALAVAAKLSMLLAVPFFLIYFLHNRSTRRQFAPFVGVLAVVGCLLVVLPLSLLEGARSMTLGNSEVAKLYSLGIQSAGVTLVYLVPLLFVLLLYGVWRIRRPNLPLVVSLMGLGFMLIVLATPASPGWFVWVVPFLVVYQAGSDRTSRLLAGLFSALFAVGALVVSPFTEASPTSVADIAGISVPLFRGGAAGALVHTGLIAVGLVLAVRVWRQAIQQNDYFRLSQTPFVLGIAGDSGAGKDTYASSVTDLFGSHSVVQVSGDDYHLWDRQRPMWRALTHLNPFANDLEGFTKDVLALADGRSVQSRHYDHETGRSGRTEVLRSNDFIIASGLHALTPPLLLQRYGLRVFLDMDEHLRRALKIQRDVVERGHAESAVKATIEDRAGDAATFIRPQIQQADVVFSVAPVSSPARPFDDGWHLALITRSRHGFDWMGMHRVLAGAVGLQVDIEMDHDGPFPMIVTVEGGVSSEDIAWAARLTCPRMIDFLDEVPVWSGGTLGLMQLMTLAHIDHALTRESLRT